MDKIDLDNKEFQDALKVINYTNNSIFLTGKAGAGKSTFLKYITQHTKKKYVVLAPTGIAAINVGGVTLHSFFRIPHHPITPDDIAFSYPRLRERMKYPKTHVKLIRELDLIIIDEISMVRCDIIDFIDKLLRFYTGKRFLPFGGKQLLLVGDIYQLEPVAIAEDREILNRYYNSVHFFSAKVFQDFPLVSVQLNKVYRQNDIRFISILDRIRAGKPTAGDISELNKHVQENLISSNDDFTITLTSLRRTADSINDIQLDKIPYPEITYYGKIQNDYPQESLPTDMELKLKVGAQVVFIKNDHDGRWVNGTIGKVFTATEDFLEIELEDGSKHVLEPETWRNIKYIYDEETNHVEEKELGSFMQYPLKLAWAITIHKSQGLTFKNVIIDIGNGAFSSGQTYVALSRCVSIDGIILRKPVKLSDIFVNQEILKFSNSFNNPLLLAKALENSRADDLYSNAAKLWDNAQYNESIKNFCEAVTLRNELGNKRIVKLLSRKVHIIEEFNQKVQSLNNKLLEAENKLLKIADEFVCLGDICALNKSEEKAALANYDKALKLVPTHNNALCSKAKLLKKQHKYEDAAKVLRVLVNKGNPTADSIILLGDTYLDLGENHDAYDCYLKAVDINPNIPEAYEGLAAILTEIGEINQAQTYLRKANALRRKRKK